MSKILNFKQKPLCIYHAHCLDGFTAAWVVKKHFGFGYNKVDMHAAQYGEKPPFVLGRDVIMVDFSFKRDVLIDMAKVANTILISDHHKSAEENLVDLPHNVTAVFDMDRSGCVMAWDYFFPNDAHPLITMHVQDRDLWTFELTNTRNFCANLASFEMTFKNWNDIDAICQNPQAYQGFVDQSGAINRAHIKNVMNAIDNGKMRTELADFDIPMLNASPNIASDAGNIMAKDEPFAMVYWQGPNGTTCSLRSVEGGEDVAKIAEQFGGGGHEHAAGFTVKKG